jgi:hypothetical protein
LPSTSKETGPKADSKATEPAVSNIKVANFYNCIIYYC